MDDDPNSGVGKSGLTALHLAARAGSTEMVKLLLGAGANPRIRDRAFNATPAGFAAHFGHDSLARILEIPEP